MESPFLNLDTDWQVMILERCTDRAKIAFGSTCKHVWDLVFKDLSDVNTRKIWNNKLTMLHGRVSWGIKQNPKTVAELYLFLNAPLFLLGIQITHQNQSLEDIPDFQSFNNKRFFNESDETLLRKIFESGSNDSYESVLKKYSERFKILEKITIGHICPGFKNKTENADFIYTEVKKLFPHARDYLGSGLLHLAIAEESKVLIEALVKEAGVPVDQLDKDGWTPLMYAANMRNGKVAIEFCKLLIELGANVDRVAKDGCTAINHCIERKNTDLAICLLSLCKYPMPVLIAEIRSQNIETVNFLFQNGLDKLINEGDREGKTPLMHACTVDKRSYEMVEWLLQRGAVESINKIDKNRNTALLYAFNKANSDNVTIVKLLLEHGASAAF